MSFDKLPQATRVKIIDALDRVSQSNKLAVDGYISVQVELTVNVEFEVEFEDVILDEGKEFVVCPERLRPDEQQVLTFKKGDRSRISDLALEECLVENLETKIQRKAEQGVENGTIGINHAEVNYIGVEDVFIENQSDLDAWNESTNQEVE